MFSTHLKSLLGAAAAALAVASTSQTAIASTAGNVIEIKGEIIDTWCYFSGVMGGPEAVTGSAHHTCALWCAAGGIPVGLLAEDGQVYMVLKIESDDHTNGGDRLLEIASHELTATGEHLVRDGVNYLVVEDVVANEGIQNLNHLDYGSVPPNSFPKKK